MSNTLTIIGVGSASTEIYLKGEGVSEKTTSDITGQFKFSRLFSLTSKYPEICLYAKKDTSDISNPVCLAPLPKGGQTPSVVGPVILPPVINFKDGVLSGYTIPNSKVTLFVNDKRIVLTSDYMGNFKENLFKIDTLNCRFVSASVQDGPLSNSLDCSPKWLLDNLTRNKLSGMVVIEVIIFVALFIMALKLTTRR